MGPLNPHFRQEMPSCPAALLPPTPLELSARRSLRSAAGTEGWECEPCLARSISVSPSCESCHMLRDVQGERLFPPSLPGCSGSV